MHVVDPVTGSGTAPTLLEISKYWYVSEATTTKLIVVVNIVRRVIGR